MFVDPPWPFPTFADPAYPDGVRRTWELPDEVHADAPDGYGSTWGPLGNRYGMRPRFAPASAKPSPAERRVAGVLVPATEAVPDGAMPKASQRFAERMRDAGRLIRVTYAQAALAPTALRPEGRLTDSVAVRWQSFEAIPQGFAMWEDDKFTGAYVRLGSAIVKVSAAELASIADGGWRATRAT